MQWECPGKSLISGLPLQPPGQVGWQHTTGPRARARPGSEGAHVFALAASAKRSGPPQGLALERTFPGRLPSPEGAFSK